MKEIHEKNTCYNFQQPKMTSLNVLFYSKPQNTHYTIMHDEEEHQIFTFEKLDPENICNFCLKKLLKQLLNYKNGCTWSNFWSSSLIMSPSTLENYDGNYFPRQTLHICLNGSTLTATCHDISHNDFTCFTVLLSAACLLVQIKN